MAMDEPIADEPSPAQPTETGPTPDEPTSADSEAATSTPAGSATGGPGDILQTQGHDRLRRIALVAALVVLGVVVLFATSGSGTPHYTPKSVVATVDAMLAGIPQHTNMLGSPTAPITLQYFGDLECPFCREFTLGSLPSIIRNWVRPGKLRIIYRSFETATRQPAVFKLQQVAALAAGLQNKMWYYLELFYHEQGEEDSGYVNERYLQRLAEQVPGLNLTEWSSARAEPALATTVEDDVTAARHVHLPGTPGLFFGLTGHGQTLDNPASLSNPAGFEKLIAGLARQE